MPGRQDPRLDQSTDTVNEQLRDRSISHLLFLLRNSTRNANQVLNTLDEDVIPDLRDRLASRLDRIDQRGFDAGPGTTQRLQDLLDSLGIILSEGRQRVEESLAGELRDLAVQEAEWQVGAVQQTVPVNLEMVVPASQQLRQIATEDPFDGMPLSRWFDGLENDTQRRLEREIRRGIVEGEGNDQIVRRIIGRKSNNYADGVINTTRRNAEAIARTATIHTSNRARQMTYQENANVIKGQVWVSTLDNRTCPTCMGYDGLADDGNGNAIPGHGNLRGKRPPAHVNCRCTTAPVLKSWREMGFDADELAESTRASMDGQVPESLTYNDWLRRRVNRGEMDVVEEALGKKRAKLFSAGGLKISEFTDRRGRQFTLQELRQREASAFERAGVKA